MAVERANWGVDFGLAELVQVAEEFQDMSSAAARQRQRWPVVFQVLAEGVPVSALLVLVAAGSGGSGRGGGRS